MKSEGKFAARVALFAALAYVLALASVYIPNVSLSFIVVFTCGAVFGGKTGMAAGGLGMFLWTVFNPFGLAPLPLSIAQIMGMIIVGLLGGAFFRKSIMASVVPTGFAAFSLMGLATGLVYQVLVSVVSAWLFGPFWEALAAGVGFALLTIISNAVIFPLCYPLAVKMAARGSN